MANKKKESQKKEIIWNLVNALLAGSLVFFGALTSGNIDGNTFIIAITTSLIIVITKFKDYWTKEEKEYQCGKKYALFNFI